ncbi:hypothetical protein AWZ03_002086 [Drosophila navojoa]|uniref:Uncharacterized protein n=1 Tax=Drosophila navojoa TaxID=7232 RepID=A0A484BS20_DRONA|nr:hypothetical protein AWZ03_002086 [Drosophila navojoa]
MHANFSLAYLDLSSAGALFAPTLLTSGSPMQQRRDSILKQQGSVKSEKRVSIKQTPSSSNLANINNNNNNNNNASKVEYVSERQVELASGPGSSKGRLTTKPPAGPRPASLIITKNDSNAQFQLLRSTSIEYEDIEAQQRASIRAIRTTLLDQQEDESAPLVFTVRK